MPAQNNRAAMIDAIAAYLSRLPDTAHPAVSVEVKIIYPEATEEHRIAVKAAAPSQRQAVEYTAVVEAYNRICGDKLPRVKLVTEGRRKNIRARLAELGEEGLYDLFRRAAASDFLCGRNDRAWVADFDWLLRPANYPKVMEGKFDNRSAVKPQSFEVEAFFARAVERAYQ